MARSLRFELRDGWFYITARGQSRERLFLDVVDARNFYERLAQIPERFGVEIHAFAMLADHYHALVRTPHGGLSRAAQWLNTSYSIGFNNRHRRAGHVFQGRYKSVLVEGGPRLLELSLHLHVNPAMVESPSGTMGQLEREQLLRSWRWSSYRAYAGLEPAPVWLTVSRLQEQAGGAAAYRRMAEDRVVRAGNNPWRDLRHGVVLGSPDFAEQVFRQAQPGREISHRADPTALASWDDIVRWVEKERGAAWEIICRTRGDWGRNAAWWAGRRWGGLTLRELGERSGGYDYATVAKTLERLDRMPASSGVWQVLAELAGHLGKPLPG